jgi:acid phosphatase
MKALRLSLQALLLGLALLTQPVRAEAPAQLPPDLLAVVWQQTSAEYKALCMQVFQGATEAMRTHVQGGEYLFQDGRLWLQTLVRHPDGRLTWDRRPVALVMDLDETVLDNSGFEAWAIQTRQTYNPKNWGHWMRFQGDTPSSWKALPGALEMLCEARKMGISPVFITNRNESGRAATLAVLRGLGLDAPDLSERLYMEDDPNEPKAREALLNEMGLSPDSAEGRRLAANSSDKERRRLDAMSRFHVVAWFGDNLYDFPVDVPNTTAPGEAIRKVRDDEVARNAQRWGTSWFVLPNPMYGSWYYGPAVPSGSQLKVLDDFGFEAWRKKNL